MKNGTANGHPPDFVVSVVRAAHETTTFEESFRSILSDISGGRWQREVDIVRTAYAVGGKDAADKPKRALPGILFSGTFSKRSASALLAHSGLICADLDHLADLEAYRDHIIADPHVLACFRSPTGTGLKVVFRCDPEKPHIESFNAVEHYVLSAFGLEVDQACKDVSRLCFVSYDPEAFVAEDAKQLPYPEAPKEFKAPLAQPSTIGLLTPGDDYDRRGDFTIPLVNAGWQPCGKDGWTRPGKSSGISATFDRVPGRFYVFSSDAAPFKERHIYRPWHIYALLEHGGDFHLAAAALYADEYGARIKKVAPVLDLDGPPPDAAGAVKLHRFPLRGIFDFPIIPDGHESILLGNRYLNRGDGAILSSSSGMGKSAMCVQMATELALNRGSFGIQGNGPLRSLIIQSEDSEGDVGEVGYSVRHVLKLTDEQAAECSGRVKVVTDSVNRGARFLAALKDYVAEFQPDLVWINPLQAFIDGDVTDAKDLGTFLREGLNGANVEKKFAYVVVHHTTKPATGKERTERLWHEVMYDMAGGAEIINWARAILSLRATATEGHFNLVLAKRGRRAGVTKEVPQGVGTVLEPVTTIPLRHANERIKVPGIARGMSLIFWEGRAADEPPANPKGAGRPEKYSFSDYRTVFPTRSSRGLEINPLWTALQTNGAIEKKTLQNTLKRWAEHGTIEIIAEPGFPQRYRAAL